MVDNHEVKVSAAIVTTIAVIIASVAIAVIGSPFVYVAWNMGLVPSVNVRVVSLEQTFYIALGIVVVGRLFSGVKLSTKEK